MYNICHGKRAHEDTVPTAHRFAGAHWSFMRPLRDPWATICCNLIPMSLGTLCDRVGMDMHIRMTHIWTWTCVHLFNVKYILNRYLYNIYIYKKYLFMYLHMFNSLSPRKRGRTSVVEVAARALQYPEDSWICDLRECHVMHNNVMSCNYASICVNMRQWCNVFMYSFLCLFIHA